MLDKIKKIAEHHNDDLLLLYIDQYKEYSEKMRKLSSEIYNRVEDNESSMHPSVTDDVLRKIQVYLNSVKHFLKINV